MQGFAQIIAYTYGMMLIKIIIESYSSVYTARIGIRVLIILLCPYSIGKGRLFQNVILQGGCLIKTDHTENIKAIMPIVYIGLLYKVGILRLIIRTAQTHSKAISLSFDSTDTNNCPYSCIITGTGIANHFYAFNFLRCQLVQFSKITQFSTIDVNKR